MGLNWVSSLICRFLPINVVPTFSFHMFHTYITVVYVYTSIYMLQYCAYRAYHTNICYINYVIVFTITVERYKTRVTDTGFFCNQAVRSFFSASPRSIHSPYVNRIFSRGSGNGFFKSSWCVTRGILGREMLGILITMWVTNCLTFVTGLLNSGS